MPVQGPLVIPGPPLGPFDARVNFWTYVPTSLFLGALDVINPEMVLGQVTLLPYLLGDHITTWSFNVHVYNVNMTHYSIFPDFFSFIVIFQYNLRARSGAARLGDQRRRDEEHVEEGRAQMDGRR